MKKNIFVVFGLACYLSSPLVMAAGSGEVNFKGVIIDAPCGIAPTSSDQTIDFGQLSLTHLNSGGHSNSIPLKIELVNCSLNIGGSNTVLIKFTGDTVGITKNLLATTGDTNTAIVISSTDGDINFGSASTAQELGVGKNTIAFQAWVTQASESNVVNAGTFTAVTNFTLEYL
ncbi:fimbrial protein [Shewanella frigidimarina]|uniref:fimbrial protein n=1 Tax=Shewanella frigidimarina TaxID=56812 RepID=UPI00316F5B97